MGLWKYERGKIEGGYRFITGLKSKIAWHDSTTIKAKALRTRRTSMCDRGERKGESGQGCGYLENMKRYGVLEGIQATLLSRTKRLDQANIFFAK